MTEKDERIAELEERCDDYAAEKGTYFRLYEDSCIELTEKDERIAQLEAENEQLSLYKNLADEYGLSVFADLSELQKQRDELLARIDVVCEVHIISQTYDRIREERQFAADDIEYDLFATGWKAAIASVKETK